jgi:hypothetical protein
MRCFKAFEPGGGVAVSGWMDQPDPFHREVTPSEAPQRALRPLSRHKCSLTALFYPVCVRRTGQFWHFRVVTPISGLKTV